VQRICFCGPRQVRPAVVLVRNGRPVRPPERVRYGASVPRLFKRIQEAIDYRFSGLKVRYGARGVPRRVELDPVKLISDDEVTFVVDRLRALPWARSAATALSPALSGSGSPRRAGPAR
jgi:hypothetical protein